jgi:hypothetical protein
VSYNLEGGRELNLLDNVSVSSTDLVCPDAIDVIHLNSVTLLDGAADWGKFYMTSVFSHIPNTEVGGLCNAGAVGPNEVEQI